MEEKHLRQHIKSVHNDERSYVCAEPDCGKSFTTATRLRRHQAVHEGQERFRCRDYPPCNQFFRKRQTLDRHIRSEHLQVAAFPCDHKDGMSGDVCTQAFETSAALRKHQQEAHSDTQFYCEECSAKPVGDGSGQHRRKGFATQAQLQTHFKETHFDCMFCGLHFTGRTSLDAHVEAQHTKPKTVEERKTFACTWSGCIKKFTKASNLNAHIRSVHQGLRFVCGEVDLTGTPDLGYWSRFDGCGEGFVTKANLENHVRYVHLKYERPETTQAPAKSKPQVSTSMLGELVGASETSRRTLSCPIAGCAARFVHHGELDAHLKSEHVVEKFFMDQEKGQQPLFGSEQPVPLFGLGQPVLEQPVVTQSSMEQPVMTQPVVTQPVVTQPFTDQQFTTQPPMNQPVTDQPALDNPTGGAVDTSSFQSLAVFDRIIQQMPNLDGFDSNGFQNGFGDGSMYPSIDNGSNNQNLWGGADEGSMYPPIASGTGEWRPEDSDLSQSMPQDLIDPALFQP